MAARLPSDCLLNIFSYFEGDARSLHSFLLTNRNWCLSVVPLLWRRTFYITSHSNFSSKKRSKLVETYLTCLDNKIIPFPLTATPTASHKPRLPTFDYASFLRGFDFYDVYHAIGNWYAFQNLEQRRKIYFDRIPDMSDDECRKLFITRELMKNFIRSSPIIDYLALDAEQSMPPQCWPLSNFSDAHNSLKYIRTFVCRGNANKQEVYNALSQWCQNIEFLSIYGIGKDDPNGESLGNLIRVQRRLCEFVLWDGTKDQLPQIIHALTLRGEKLTSLEFRFCDFSKSTPLETLANSCTGLKTLKLIRCGEIHSNLLESCLTPAFLDLNNLDLQGTYVSSEPLEVIFKWSNIDLRSLHVESSGGRFRIPKILESIASHCPNITHLKVRTKKDKLPQLVTLFRSCRNLQSLKIYGSSPDRLFFFAHDTDDELLMSLRQVIPIKLRTLVLKTDCAFTSLAIDTFLKDCCAELKQLEYISYGSIWQHLNVVKRYARRRGLEVERQVAGNYKELLMRELGYIIMEFGKEEIVNEA